MQRSVLVAFVLLTCGTVVGIANAAPHNHGLTAQQASPVTAPTPPPRGGGIIHYAAGWNLVAGNGTSAITGTSGPLYTLQAGDTSYRAVPSEGPLTLGVGYWAYFPHVTDAPVPTGDFQPLTVEAPAGQFIMVGSPYPTYARVSGADAVFIYDAATATYRESTTVDAGYGAWAYSMAGAAITLASPFSR